MPLLYGKNYTKQELLKRVGEMSQIAGATRFEYTDGKSINKPREFSRGFCLFREKAVFLPFCRVFVNIIPNFKIVHFSANDMVIKRALPKCSLVVFIRK